jgi:hypothetical protein
VAFLKIDTFWAESPHRLHFRKWVVSKPGPSQTVSDILCLFDIENWGCSGTDGEGRSAEGCDGEVMEYAVDEYSYV